MIDILKIEKKLFSFNRDARKNLGSFETTVSST